LIAILSGHAGGGLEALADRVFEAVRSFAGGGEQQDDQTLLLARAR
jgi:serine phosphatase RsbU (regulator of sigma subunit)